MFLYGCSDVLTISYACALQATSVYRSMSLLSSNCCLLCCCLLCCCTYRIRQWTGDTRGWYKAGVGAVFPSPGQSYVFIYAMLTLAFLVLMLFRGATFQYASLGGAQRLHKKMLHK